jgi:hypothetical protein
MAVVDKREAMRRAQRALEAKQPDDALAALWPLMDRAHVPDDEARVYLRTMQQAWVAAERPEAAASVALYLGDLDTAARLAQEAPRTLARVHAARGKRKEAARAFEAAGWPGHAAMQLEDAGDDRGARVLWERLADDVALREDLYTQALVRFNLGRACGRLGDAEAARKSTVQSLQLLEAAADGFEQRGLRERAFDCYQVLVSVGRAGAFENLAEGYLNCIRILREDHLKYYVLQYYEDFLRLALERRELVAAATLFREAADFARRSGLPFARYYTQRAAETHLAAAQAAASAGAPAELVENAYTAAIETWTELGAFAQVRATYGLLATLALPEKRRARYLRLYARLADVPDEAGPRAALPAHLRVETAYPEVWRLDVIEWEEHGDPAETMGEVAFDAKYPEFTRRRALLARLHALGDGAAQPDPTHLAALAVLLGRSETYAALAPLERLYRHPDPRVRAACLRATRQLYFKRSFVLVQLGLRDPEAGVRREALAAIGQLHFAHALDPLGRIYRESSDPEVRSATLASIARVPGIEALELLVDALRHGLPEEQAIARAALERSDHLELDALLETAESTEHGAARAALRDLRRARIEAGRARAEADAQALDG